MNMLQRRKLCIIALVASVPFMIAAFAFWFAAIWEHGHDLTTKLASTGLILGFVSFFLAMVGGMAMPTSSDIKTELARLGIERSQADTRGLSQLIMDKRAQ